MNGKNVLWLPPLLRKGEFVDDSLSVQGLLQAARRRVPEPHGLIPRLASGSDDMTVRLWDTTTGGLQQALEGHSGPVWSVAFSPDGRLPCCRPPVAVSQSRTVLSPEPDASSRPSSEKATEETGPEWPSTFGLGFLGGLLARRPAAGVRL
jgi:WD40 repeat protein